MAQPPKKNLLTPERTLQVADSLFGVGYTKVKSSLKDEENKDKIISKFRTKEQVEDSIQKLSNEGLNDIKNSYRYKSLALKAMKKNK